MIIISQTRGALVKSRVFWYCPEVQNMHLRLLAKTTLLDTSVA
jgi:hypothetical protein